MIFLTLLVVFTLPVQASVVYESKYLEVRAHGYCPCRVCCGKNADGKTATGRSAWRAGIAVDPKVIPLGSYTDIPGYDRGPNDNGSWIKADDTGRLIKGRVIDVRFRTHAEALDWGTRKIRIRVWRKR